MNENSKIKNTFNLMIFVISLTIFVCMLILIATNNNSLQTLDNNIAFFCSKNRLRFFDYFFVIISYLGETKLIAAFCLILLLLPNRKDVGLPVVILTSISALLNLIIKIAVIRERPDGYFLTEPTLGYSMPTSYSFPSGHSQTANLFYFSLVFVSLKYFKHQWQKNILAIFTIFFCCFMCFARIYLGVHFFSDVVAGLMLMISIISISIFIDKKTNKCSLNIYE